MVEEQPETTVSSIEVEPEETEKKIFKIEDIPDEFVTEEIVEEAPQTSALPENQKHKLSSREKRTNFICHFTHVRCNSG